MAIVCPLHGGSSGAAANGTNGTHNVSRQNSSASSSPRMTQRQISNQSTTSSSNGSTLNGQISRKSSQNSSHLDAIKSPTSSHESYESALSSQATPTPTVANRSISSSSSTLKSSNLAQPEDDDDLEDADENALNNGNAASMAPKSECSRFTRQALYTYRAKNHIIHYKYSAYGGTCHDLPK